MRVPEADPKLDATSRLLIAAAYFIEDNTLHSKRDGLEAIHPARALHIVSGGSSKRHKAWYRLCDCVGADFMDHSPTENIADLVAAAFWEVPDGA